MKDKRFLIIIDGPMGSGKSTTAKALHKRLPHSASIGLDFIRRTISNFDLDNKNHHKISSDMLDLMITKYLKEGHNTIVERSITKEEDIIRLRKLIGNGVKILCYRIEAPIDIRVKRVKERKISSMLKKGSTIARIKRNNLYYEKLKHQRPDKVLDSTKLTTNQIVNKIIKDLKAIS